MNEILTQILNIPNYKVIGIETDDEQITLDIQSTTKGAKCPRCGTYSSELHENHPRIVRDLPISGKACYLRFTRRRFFCPKCNAPFNAPFSEPLGFVKEHRDYTNRYQARIFHQVKENNVTAVMRLESLTYEQVESIFLTEAKSYIPANPFTGLTHLGIDEISLRKGKKDFVLILSNLDTGEIVDVIEKRTKEKLHSRLEKLTSIERNQITEVAIDMWESYADVCSELLPQGVVTVDRFHVAKAINTEPKGLKNKEKNQLPEALKGSHHPLLKNQENLTDKQQEILQKIYETCPILKMGHRLKECLHRIFESHSTKQKATLRIQKWLTILQ